MLIPYSPRWDPIRSVAVTVENSPDLTALGLRYFHYRQAKARVALEVLQLGRSLVYRGSLDQDGFLDFIYQLMGRYLDHPHHDGPIRVTSYLAWSDHIALEEDEIFAMFKAHKRHMVSLVMLGMEGERLSLRERIRLKPRQPSEEVRCSSTAVAHRVICEHSDALIVAGGAFEGSNGNPPDIADQALLSLQVKQPLYLIGGYGGCTRAIAEALGMVDRWSGSRWIWPGSDAFSSFGVHSLHNQLSLKENQIVANTRHISRAMVTIMDGCHRFRKKIQPKVA